MSSSDEIIKRMMEACGAGTASQLAEYAGFHQSVVSQWRKRGNVPEGVVAKLANMTNVNMDWLLTGNGEMRPGGYEYFSDQGQGYRGERSGLLGKELVRVVIEAVEEGLGDLRLELKPDKKAQLVITLCEMFEDEKKVDKPTLLRLIRLAA